MFSLGLYVASLNVRLTSVPMDPADGFGSGRKKRYVQAQPLVHLEVRGAALALTTNHVAGVSADVGVKAVALNFAPLAASEAGRPAHTILQLGPAEDRDAQSYLHGSLFAPASSIPNQR